MKTGTGSGNYNYEQERDLVFLWGWDAGFARGTEQDTLFQFLHDRINCYWPAQKPQAGRNKPFVHIAVFTLGTRSFFSCTAEEKPQAPRVSCVRFQVMNSNGSVPCQILSNISIHYRLTTLVSLYCVRSLSPIAIICVDLWHQWHLSISNIFDACVCNLGPPILSSFNHLLTFSRVPGLFWPDRMVIIGLIVIYRTKYATLWIASQYITKRMSEQECLRSERKVLRPDSKESEDTESFERNCQVCLWAFSWIWEWAIIFFHWYVDKKSKTKQNSKLFTERNVINNHLCLLICYPLNSFLIFYAIFISKKFLC